MVNQAQTVHPRRWNSRATTRVGLPLVIAVLFSIAVVQLWTSNTADLKFTGAEQQGVAYLKPLTDLMDRAIAAQSLAVRGSAVDAAGLRSALAKVDAVDNTYGADLGSRQRWTDVKSRVEYLVSLRPTGEGAYRAYTDAVQLIDDLIRKIADTSNLILDPKLDSYYLMDSVVLRLPNVLLFAGRASDLAALSAKATDTESRVQANTRVSVARYQVSQDSDEIASGLRKALDMTASKTLGPNITNQLDTFRTAIDAFVPPVNLLQNLDTVEATTLTANADRVREAAKKLSSAVLDELDRLVGASNDAQGVARSQALGLGALCVLLTAMLVWLLVRQQYEGAEPAPKQPVATEPPVRAHRPESRDDFFNSANASEELVQAGRAIRARRRERADDAR